MSKPREGRVSVVVPARDEEETIACTVRSVASQEGVREILVVDDQSQDRTAETLEALKTEIPCLRTIQIEALPDGWSGKSHALATGARAASGEWLLFTDADTQHLPGSLAELLARAEQEGADLLSVSPGQRTLAWWEKAVIPLVYVHLARLYRFEEVSDPQTPAAAANGQYMLMRREAYERAGGHEAVRAEILEDVELARRTKATGGRLLFLPGAAWVETRMYRSFRQMWTGWSKNLYLLYGRRLARMLRTLAEVWLLDGAPLLIFLVFCILFALGRGSAATTLAAVVFIVLAVLRQWNYARALSALGFNSRLANYQVPGAALFGLLLLDSWRVHRCSRSVQWKGRRYSAKESG